VIRLMCLVVTIPLLLSPARAQDAPRDPRSDPRNIRNGRVIPDEGYCDQPYLVKTDDGHWLCVMTTGRGVEGQPGQHIVAARTADRGRTWSDLIPIEPADGPEASWVMPLKVPGGRIYAFYTHNTDNFRRVPGRVDPRVAARVDTLGHYAYRFSDDQGRTWSEKRYEIPMRRMRIDRENNSSGEVLQFWGVGKPIVHGDSAIFGFAKVGKWGIPGAMVTSQGAFLKSDNILTERDPEKHHWVTLPDGDEGLRAPKGPVSDEANLISLSDGSLYATYRTIDGYPCHAYSRDGGRTWTPSAYATYGPEGRRIKHSRAANFVRKFSNGKYLYWFHNHGGEAIHAARWEPYNGRNPAWVCGGVEEKGFIHWSEPEILLYDDAPATRISYPDFLEEDGRYFVTETQKTVARVHEVDAGLLEGLWTQRTRKEVARDGLALEMPAGPIAPGTQAKAEALKTLDLQKSGGFTIDFWVRLDELTENQTLLDARSEGGRGIALTTTDRWTIRLTLNDGQHTSNWDSDPGTGPGTLTVGAWHHVAVIVEAGPKLILFVVDGVLNDGGAVREYGWGRFDPAMGDVGGADQWTLASRAFGEIRGLRGYGRALRVSEAVGNYRAGR
jgi:hypothetical protein